MRKWIIIGAIILLLLGGAIAIALSNLNSYLNQNKDWLAAQVETALGRKVSFEEIGVSLTGGFGARVKNLRIADDATFSDEDFVRASSAQVRIKVLPALFGRYEVKRVVLGSPMVTLIRSKAGFNFDSIGKKEEKETVEEEEKEKEAKEQEALEEPTSAEEIPLLVSFLQITDGEIHFVDRTAKPATDLLIQKLDFSASDVSLTTPVKLNMAAALFGSKKQNFELDAKVGPLETPVDIQQAPLEGKIELDPLDIDALRQALPEVANRIPPGLGLTGPIQLKASFGGSLAQLSISGLELAASVFEATKSNFQLSGTIGPLGATVPTSDIALDLRLDLGPVATENLKKLDALAKALPPGLGLSGPAELKAHLTGSPVKLAISDLELSASAFETPQRNVKVSGALGPVGAAVATSDLKLDLAVELGPVVLDSLKKLQPLENAIPPELSSPDPIHLSASLRGAPEDLGIKAKLDATPAAMRYGKAFTKPKDVPMTLDLSAQRSGASVDVKNLALRLAELDLTGRGTVTTGEETTLDLHVDTKRASLEGWERLFPALAGQKVSGAFEMHINAKGRAGGGQIPKLNGTLALHEVNAQIKGWQHPIEGLSTTVRFEGDSAVLPPTKFRLGGSPVELEAKVENFKAPTVTFVFQSPELKASSVGAAGKEVKKEEVARGLAVRGTYRKGVKGPDFHGVIRSKSGTLRDIDYQDLQADLDLRDRVAVLDRLALRAFDGTYDGAGRYDMQDAEKPTFDFQSSVRGMILKGLLSSKFPDAEKRIEGRLDADIALAGKGKKWQTIRNALRGEGRMEVKDGVLKDVNLAEGVLGGLTGVPGLSDMISPRVQEKYPGIFSEGDTPFELLQGTVQIAEGRARTEDLTLSAKDYTILGKGTFAFENRLDFTAILSASQQLTDDVVSDVHAAKYLTNEQGRLSIPFRAKGTLPKVRPKPDGEFIAKAMRRGFMEGGIEKLLSGGKEKSGEQPAEETGEQKKPRPEQELLKKTLEGIFGR